MVKIDNMCKVKRVCLISRGKSDDIAMKLEPFNGKQIDILIENLHIMVA